MSGETEQVGARICSASRLSAESVQLICEIEANEIGFAVAVDAVIH
jgi:hypothetical protein